MSEKQMMVALFCIAGCLIVGVAVALFFFAHEPAGGWDRDAYYEDLAKIFSETAELPAEEP